MIRKPSYFYLAALAMLGLLFLVFDSKPQPKTKELKGVEVAIDLPKPALEISIAHESSKKFLTQKTPSGTRVAWSDGTVDLYTIADSVVQRLTRTYPNSETILMDASFKRGRFSQILWYRADSSLEKSYVRTQESESSQVWTNFAKDGKTVLSTIVRLKDGTTVTNVLNQESGAFVTNLTPAKIESKTFGEVELSNSQKFKVLTVGLLSGTFNSFEWNRGDGDVKIVANIDQDFGFLEIKTYTHNWLRIIQHYEPYVEDFDRVYYRLAHVQLLNRDGSKSRSIFMNPDGHTLKRIEDWNDEGKLNFVKEYDKQGSLVLVKNYPKDKAPFEEHQTSTLPEKLDPQFGPSPGGSFTRGEIFNLGGIPFKQRTQQDRDIIKMYFVEPGQVLSPEVIYYFP